MVPLSKKLSRGFVLLPSLSGERKSEKACSELPQAGVYQVTGATTEICHKITPESFLSMGLDPCGQAGAVSPSPEQI